MLVEVVLEEEFLSLVPLTAEAAPKVAAPFEVFTCPWVELVEDLAQVLMKVEDSTQGYFLMNRALVIVKEALLDLALLVGAAVVTPEAPFQEQTSLSAELVERLAEVLADVSDSVTRGFLGRKRTLAVLLVQVDSTGSVEPVFPAAAFQVGNLALEETLGRGASAEAGIVEQAVLEEVL